MILITRPHKKAQQLATQLKKKNISSCIDSLFSFSLPTAKINLKLYSDCLIASTQAVNAIKEKHSNEIKYLKKSNLYVIGQETAKALVAIKIKNIKKVFQNSDDLASYLSSSSADIKKLCYLSSNVKNTKLIKELTARKIVFFRKIVYTVRVKKKFNLQTVHALKNKRIKAVTLYSMYTAHLYASYLTAARVTRQAQMITHVCLSKDIARFMKKKGFKKVLSASKPTEVSLIQAIGKTLN